MNTVEKVRAWIRDFSGRESIRNIGYIYSSRLITAVMRFAAAIMVARALGRERLGLLTIAAVIMGISERFLELGFTTTMIRKMSLHISRGEHAESIGLFRRIFRLRLMISGAFAVAAWFLAPVVAVRVYGNPALTAPLRLAAAGAIGWNLWNQVDGVLRATERFKAVAAVSLASQAVRVSLVLLFAWKAMLNVENTMVFNIMEVFVAFVITSVLIPGSFMKGKSAGKYSLREIFSYSGWMYVFSLIFMLFDRLDVLMLGYFRQASEVGLYGVAFTLIRPFELIPETLNTVFLPKVSRFTKKLEIFRYFRDTLKVTGIVGVLCLVLIFAARPLLLFFYGPEYEGSIQLFQILVGAFILLTILNPFTLVGHSINKPELFVIMASINLILNFIGNLIFIPRYGAVGAAIVTLVSRVLGGILGLAVLKIYLGRWREEN